MLAGIEDVPSEHAELSVDLVELAAHPPPPPDEARVPKVSVAHLEDDHVAYQSDMDIVPKDIPLPPETPTSVHLEEIPLPPSQDCQVEWSGLHLFNDNTRPSGHISRPSQVGFSHRSLRSINEF